MIDYIAINFMCRHNSRKSNYKPVSEVFNLFHISFHIKSSYKKVLITIKLCTSNFKKK